MVSHLREIVSNLSTIVSLDDNDLVVDIGSNDGTLLSFYPETLMLVGIDPTAAKFQRYYRSDIRLIPDFFSAERFLNEFGGRKAKIVSSIAMFYDLDQPLHFVKDIESILAPDGIWHFEQSYLPSMLKATAYDTICHEHVEYYGLRQIKHITDQIGLKIIDIQLNEVNGGSFAVTVAKRAATYHECTERLNEVIEAETTMGLSSLKPYECFRNRVDGHRAELLRVLDRIKKDQKKMLGYGASTKGNVILQFCGITSDYLPSIAEVNEDKFGCFTPGSNIPIIPEQEARLMNPDFLLVLPWHFRRNLIERESEYLRAGGKMIFPLPQIEVVSA